MIRVVVLPGSLVVRFRRRGPRERRGLFDELHDAVEVRCQPASSNTGLLLQSLLDPADVDMLVGTSQAEQAGMVIVRIHV